MRTTSYEFDVQDIEYLRHADEPLLASCYQPRGKGPFRAVIEVHGGAWTHFERTRGKSLHEALARSGVVVLALDFRQGKSGHYPASSQDINYGVRWLKANAVRFKTRPELVGISGNSSGGHLVMLGAMRQDNSSFNSIALPLAAPVVDASVRCVVMLWPVINPLGRYRMAQRELARPNPKFDAAAVIRCHDDYWGSEEAQLDANPMLMLERGEKVALPPALWIQATQDEVHNYRDEASGKNEPEAERFANNYRSAGGELELKYYDAPKLFTTIHPTLPASIQAIDDIVTFVHERIPL